MRNACKSCVARKNNAFEIRAAERCLLDGCYGAVILGDAIEVTLGGICNAIQIAIVAEVAIQVAGVPRFDLVHVWYC